MARSPTDRSPVEPHPRPTTHPQYDIQILEDAMPCIAITYDIKGGQEDKVAEVFSNFQRPKSPVVSGADGKEAARILATAVFIRDSLLVRFVEYEGDLDAVARFMASRPAVQEIERKLKPYLNSPRDTDTVEGFIQTFKDSMLRCITQLSVPRDAALATKDR